MLSIPLIAVFFVTLGIIWWFRRENEGGKYKTIPGPIGIPLLGNALQVGSKMHLKFYEWAEKYGDIFQIRLGVRRAVVISNPKLIKEIFTVDPAFAGRQFFEGLEMYPNEPLGIVSSEGELWEVHRRFLLRQLRDFGFGKSSMEHLVLEEVKETIERFKEGKRISNTKEIFQVAVINSLWTIVGGKRFKHDDPKLLEMMSDSHRLTDELISRSVYFLVPWTRYILPKLKGFEEIRDRNKKFYEDATAEHKANFNKENLRLLRRLKVNGKVQTQRQKTRSVVICLLERQLNVILADLFFAGSDTTSNTLAWAVLYLAKFKSVQQKLQHEISMITGNTRNVSISDRPNMPYTLAVMEETFRMSSIVPSGVQHRAIVGKEFKGYFIEQDTWIFANLWHLHHNPKTWGDPKTFRPERFLSPDEKTFKRSENVMAFQIGRRQCVGETLARDSFFLFLTNLFQKFSFSLDPKYPEPSMEAPVGFVLSPEDYHIVLEDRE